MKTELKNKIWNMSRHAQELPKDWLVVPALKVIELLEKEEQSSGEMK